jgi:propanol-preferring alcohol dehydrogenase
MRLHRAAPAETNPLRLDEIPRPQPEPGQVLLKVLACGVCHTDLHITEGDLQPPRMPVTGDQRQAPLIPGHQVVAQVEAIGDEGKNQQNLRIGDRVGVPWLFSACGECSFCLSGQENLCPEAKFTGLDVDGGYANFMVAEGRYVLKLPQRFSDEQAAPLLCAGIVGYRSLRLAEVKPGERLGLVGFGASAHLVLQVARNWGCKIYVFTRAEEHRRHALDLGADWAGGIEEPISRSLDRAILFAPSGKLVPPTLEKIRPGGTFAINAVTMDDIPAFPYALIYGERTLRSVANATYQDGVEFLKLADEIGLQPTTTLYPLEAANQALQDMKHSRLNGEAVLAIPQ